MLMPLVPRSLWSDWSCVRQPRADTNADEPFRLPEDSSPATDSEAKFYLLSNPATMSHTQTSQKAAPVPSTWR